MLAVARAQPVDEAAAPISYVEGDALALPVDDDAFDVATCHHGLQFFPDRPAAVAELRRALAPGGRVGIGCWTRFDETAHFVAIADVLTRHLGAEVGQAMRSPFALSADDLIGLLQGSGFEDVNVEPITLPVTYASHKEYARLALGAGPLAVPFAAAPQETQTAIVADITEAVAPLADGDTVKTEMTSLVAIAVA
jgi:SAM-dependent methyltransferase